MDFLYPPVMARFIQRTPSGQRPPVVGFSLKTFSSRHEMISYAQEIAWVEAELAALSLA